MLSDNAMDQLLREAGDGWRATRPGPAAVAGASAFFPDADERPTRIHRRWRTGVAALTGAALVAAVVVIAVMLQPSHSRSPAVIDGANPGGLTSSEYALALRIAHHEILTANAHPASSTAWPSTLRSVAAIALPGAKAGAYISPGAASYPSEHDRVLVVRLIGTFSVITGGTPCRSSGPCSQPRVTALTEVINLKTGKQIVGTAQTNRHPAQLPHATTLYQRGAPVPAPFRLRLHLDTTKAQANGNPIHGSVTVINNTGKPIKIADACNSWIDVGLTTSRIHFNQLNGAVACAASHLRVGTTTIKVTVSTRYQQCEQVTRPTGDPNLPNCSGGTGLLPPLPAGRYHAVMRTMSLNRNPALPAQTTVTLTGP